MGQCWDKNIDQYTGECSVIPTDNGKLEIKYWVKHHVDFRKIRLGKVDIRKSIDKEEKHTFISTVDIQDLYKWGIKIENLDTAIKGRDVSLETIKRYIPPMTIHTSEHLSSNTITGFIDHNLYIHL